MAFISVVCRHCSGEGARLCADCAGTGQLPAPRGAVRRCGGCRGSGLRPCEACNGDGAWLYMRLPAPPPRPYYRPQPRPHRHVRHYPHVHPHPHIRHRPH